MARIEVQKPYKKPYSTDDILARFCFYFPQYTLEQARKIPQKRIMQMLKVVDREHAMMFANLTRIVASPHTKRGEGVKKLFAEFKDKMS